MALYHYTTEKRLEGIVVSGEFRPSTDSQHDAAYGEGWYFTDLPPGTCEKKLMLGCWQKTTLHRRVQYYMQVKVVRGQLHWKRSNVYFVPLAHGVSFELVDHGPVPECEKKPCSSCPDNPEK